jgi:hypothetical protein
MAGKSGCSSNKLAANQCEEGAEHPGGPAHVRRAAGVRSTRCRSRNAVRHCKGSARNQAAAREHFGVGEVVGDAMAKP